MNAPDFSSTPNLKQLLGTLSNSPLPNTLQPLGPLDVWPNGTGSSWEQDVVSSTRAALSLDDLTQTLPADKRIGRSHLAALLGKSPIARTTEQALRTTDPLGTAANELAVAASLLPSSAAASSTTASYPGYALRYDPGFPLDNRPAVAQWQAQMKQRGWSLTVDGWFGPQSDRIARQFQAEKGLIVDGIVGLRTWQAAFDNSTLTRNNEADPTPNTPPVLTPSFSGDALSYRPLQPLSFDPQAQAFQQRLQSLGWNLEADGFFGPRTAAATRLFQQQHNLDTDGIVGPLTWTTAFDTNALTAPAQQDLNQLYAGHRIIARRRRDVRKSSHSGCPRTDHRKPVCSVGLLRL